MITGLATGAVRGRLTVPVNDGTDPDAQFDTIAPSGWVYLRPRVSAYTDGSPDPVIVIPDELSLPVDAEGYVTVPDSAGAPTAVREVTVPVLEGMTWQASFDLTIPAFEWQHGVTANRLRIAPFDIPVEAGQTTDLAEYVPIGVDPSTGQTWVRGPRGLSIADARGEDGTLTLVLEDGTELSPVELPAGPQGPPGPDLDTLVDVSPTPPEDTRMIWVDPAAAAAGAALVVTGPGRPDQPATTGGALTGDEPVGAVYTSTDGAGVGAWGWSLRPTGWECTDGSTGAWDVTGLIAAGGGDRTGGFVSVTRSAATVQLMLNDVLLSRTDAWGLLMALPVGFRPASTSVKANLVAEGDAGNAVLIVRRSDGQIWLNRRGPGVRHALTLAYLTTDPWPEKPAA